MAIDPMVKDRLINKYRGDPGQGAGMDIPDKGGSGITCGAINCDNNKDKKCAVSPEISAGGACMTYSKSGESVPMEGTPGGEAPMPEGGEKGV